MRRPFPLNLLLLASVFLGCTGAYMALDAEKTDLCLLAASSQMEFFKMFPGIMQQGDKVPLPTYTDIPFMKLEKNISGASICVYYSSNPSLRLVTVSASYKGREKAKLETILDARQRR